MKVGNESLKLAVGIEGGPVLQAEYLTNLRKVFKEYRHPTVTQEVSHVVDLQ